MKNQYLITMILFLVFTPQIVLAQQGFGRLGYIFLQVEEKGEAWYVYPRNGRAYYLGRPTDAFTIMKSFALGAEHDFIVNTEIFPERLSGMILLDANANGEAFYINPLNKRKYYLGRPDDAFRIMRELGRGISNADLEKISKGSYLESGETDISPVKTLIEGVPFSSQAPKGNWADSRQQNGCEEISALMAIKWVRGEDLGRDEALEEVIGISDWLLKEYGEFRDISAQDTVDWIFKEYFAHDKVVLAEDVVIADIIRELNKGNLLVVPMNGQILDNPNFKFPGPPRHMLVIRGYDPAAKEFITNDPGTRNGELYRYAQANLYEAIRDYPTGYHEKIKEVEKNMIVVSR